MRTASQIAAYYKQLATDYAGQALLRRCRASIHLENRDDEWYWDRMLQKYRPGTYNYIYYSCHEAGAQTSGCTQCLQFREHLSSLFFICIDSDYRYLRQESGIDYRYYICQTYTYSWENHYCVAERLQESLLRKLPERSSLFDFNIFLKSYSSVVYRPLLLYLFMDRKGLPGFTQKTLNGLSALQYQTGDLADNGAAAIQRLRASLESFTNPLEIQTGFDIEQEKSFYAVLGLSEENAYLHFRGHNVYDMVRSIGRHLCSGTNVSFEYDILLDYLAFDTYWEIKKSGENLSLLS